MVLIDSSAHHLFNHSSDRENSSRVVQNCLDNHVFYSVFLDEAVHVGLRYGRGTTRSDHSAQDLLKDVEQRRTEADILVEATGWWCVLEGGLNRLEIVLL